MKWYSIPCARAFATCGIKQHKMIQKVEECGYFHLFDVPRCRTPWG